MAGYLSKNRGNTSPNRIGATVSRKLRTNGWNISSNARKYRHDGIFVSACENQVTVMIDLGLDTQNRRVTDELVAELVGQSWADNVDINWPKVTGAVFVYFDYIKANQTVTVPAADQTEPQSWEQLSLW